MIIDIKIPSPGESITEVELARWLVNDGAYVNKDQELAEIESDKATLPIVAEKAGKLQIVAQEGATVKVGDIACKIDTDAEVPAEEQSAEKAKPYEKEAETKPESKPKDEEKTEKPTSHVSEANTNAKVTPVAKKMMEAHKLNVDDIIKGLKKIGSKEVNAVLQGKDSAQSFSQEKLRGEDRQKMSSLRKKLSQRLVDVKNQTAMLTTFNEVDMSAVMDMRKKYQKQFIDKHGIKVGFMSFFTKAAAIALQHFPKVNSYIDGEEIVTPQYTDISIAVQTDKGLMVPVVRNVEALSLAEIELQIKDLAEKARKFRLPIEDMTGGTFTITNGGVFGSMLSTPIINPPQSGILGMHNIVERPVAVNGKVEIRPVMYIALSYDHRIVDGRDSVGFLYKMKEIIEDPTLILTGGTDVAKGVLGL